MIKILKMFWWSIRKKSGRYAIAQWMFRNVPREYGVEIRRRAYRRYFGKMGEGVRIHEGVRIVQGEKLFLGDFTHIGIDNMLQAAGGIEIGEHVVLGPNVKIWSINHRFDDIDTPVMDQGYDFKKVIIGDKCWIGSNVFIMPGANIGEGVIVSAGSVVGGKTVPPYKILAGNPARVIGTREPQPAADDSGESKSGNESS
jgi:acetyltransferase-like isoleucine patch superfamily enzyme